MKRCVIASREPWRWIPQFDDYSIMIINPDTPKPRYQYLLDNSDYSVLVTDSELTMRDGRDHPNERVFWYTSGTTGDSKFYGFSRSQVEIMAQTICRDYNITADDRYFGIMPLWHAHGQGFYWATRLAGCETQFGTIRDKSKIESLQPTFVTSIPDMMSVIMRLDLNTLRFVRTASSSMPTRLFNDLRDRFGVPVIEAFGMTEALSHCFTNPLAGPQKIGTVGLPSGIDAKINDGRLLIRGPCVFQSDWFDTGDLAECDSDGYYRILGRSRDQINVRGIKIHPLSIENQLIEQFPGIQQCAVFGTNSLKCVFRGSADLDQIKNFLVGLGPQCKPSVLAQVDEIPLNGSGKISRSQLNGLFD